MSAARHRASAAASGAASTPRAGGGGGGRKGPKSAFDFFCVSNNLYVEKGGGGRNGATPYTHTLFNGGCLHVPDHLHDQFLTCVANELAFDHMVYINELATSPVFRLFFDLDFEDVVPAPARRAAEPVQALLDAERSFELRRSGQQDDEHSTEAASSVSAVADGGHAIALVDAVAVIERMQATVHAYYSDEPPNAFDASQRLCIVLRAATHYSTVVRNGETKLRRKTGFHIVWPTTYVTREQALHIRAGIVNVLRESMPRPVNGNAWHDIVDEQVLRREPPSLRLAGCDKVAVCGTCGGRGKGGACSARCDNGKLREHRAYLPVLTLNAAGRTTTHYKEFGVHGVRDTIQFINILRYCSIRAPGVTVPTADFRIPEPADKYRCANVERAYSDSALRARTEKETKRQRAKSSRSAAASAATLVAGGGAAPLCDTVAQFGAHVAGMYVKASERKDVPQGTPVWDAVYRLLRDGPCMPDDYRRVQIKSIAQVQSARGTPWYAVSVTGDEARYCQNVGRRHNSVVVYFRITWSKGLFQRCYCRCPSLKGDATSTLCRDYESNGWPVPRDLQRILFPDQFTADERQRAKAEQARTLLLQRNFSTAPPVVEHSFVVNTADGGKRKAVDENDDTDSDDSNDYVASPELALGSAKRRRLVE